MLNDRQTEKDLHMIDNWHTGIYICKTMQAAVKYLDNHKLTFVDVHQAHLVFAMYENRADHEGLEISADGNLQRVHEALKGCGLACANAKLIKEVKLATRSAGLPPRLRLYEFFRVMTKATPISEVKAKLRSTDVSGKTQRSIYKMPNFDDILYPMDQRIEEQVRGEYQWAVARSKVRTVIGTVRDLSSAVKPAAVTRQQVETNKSREFRDRMAEDELKLTRARSAGRSSSARRATSSHRERLMTAPARLNRTGNARRFARRANVEAGGPQNSSTQIQLDQSHGRLMLGSRRRPVTGTYFFSWYTHTHGYLSTVISTLDPTTISFFGGVARARSCN